MPESGPKWDFSFVSSLESEPEYEVKSDSTA